MAKRPAAKRFDPQAYTGPVRHDRWQVCELGHGLNVFAIFDRQTLRLVRGKDEQPLHLTSKEAAEAHIAQLAGVKPPKQAPVTKPAATAKVTKPSAAGLFRELLLGQVKSGLSDDAIFKRVQQEFKLDDSRRSYVDWYRKDLIKKGQLSK